MKPYQKWLAFFLSLLGLFWMSLTFWAQRERYLPCRDLKTERASAKALVLFNPDPIYHFDRQITKAVAEGMQAAGWHVRICTYASAETLEWEDYDYLVVVANTYNWAPDRTCRRFVAGTPELSGMPVLAMTLGSGATRRSRRLLEESLEEAGTDLRESLVYWLLRPNDETQLERSNIRVAVEMARKAGQAFALESGKVSAKEGQ